MVILFGSIREKVMALTKVWNKIRHGLAVSDLLVPEEVSRSLRAYGWHYECENMGSNGMVASVNVRFKITAPDQRTCEWGTGTTIPRTNREVFEGYQAAKRALIDQHFGRQP